MNYITKVLFLGIVLFFPIQRANANTNAIQSIISSGEVISSGNHHPCPSQNCYLYMQHDGNLVLYRGVYPNSQGAIWATGTSFASDNYYATLQGDGNMVIYQGSPENRGGAIYASNSVHEHGQYFLGMEEGDRLCIYPGTENNPEPAIWCNIKYALNSGEKLLEGEILRSSNQQAFMLTQSDGNIVVYRGTGMNDKTEALWASASSGTAEDYFLNLQSDGNIVLYQGTPLNVGDAIWSTGSRNNNPYFLAFDNANLKPAIYSGSKENPGQLLWYLDGTPVSTNTMRSNYNAIVIHYNPKILIDNQGTVQRAADYFGWRNIPALTAEYRETLKRASGGQVNWNIADFITVDGFPPGHGLTAENYLTRKNNGPCYGFEATNYLQILEEYDIVNRVNQGELDAVWIFGLPCATMWETCMAGEDAYWVNGSPVSIPGSKRFIIYGFGQEAHQGVGFMLENTGHMTATIISRHAQDWPQKWTIPVWDNAIANDPYRKIINQTFDDWSRFILSDQMNWNNNQYVAPGRAEVGSTHFPPTGYHNYSWPVFEEKFWSMANIKVVDGDWSTGNNKLHVNAGQGVKAVLHPVGHWDPRDFTFGDFEAQFVVSAIDGETNSNAGLLFRAANYAAGENKVMGYYLSVSAISNQIKLVYIDDTIQPSQEVVGGVSVSINEGKSYPIRIYADGPQIKVFFDNQSTPIIDVTDSRRATGSMGFMSNGTDANFSELIISPFVKTYADHWYEYPEFSNNPRNITCQEWGCNHDDWFKWWFEHLPKNPGTHSAQDVKTGEWHSGILNNWWAYIYELDAFGNAKGYFGPTFPAIDVVPPAAPQNLQAFSSGPTSISLAWEEPQDNVGVTRYEVYRDGQLLGHSPKLTFTDSELTTNAQYTYEVKARDGSGNVSSGAYVTATTGSSGILNGEFEVGLSSPLFWEKDAFKPNNVQFIWELPGESYDGTRTISINNTSANDSRWLQTVANLIPGARYKLEGYIKGENIVQETGYTGATLGIFHTWETTNSLVGSFDWTKVSLTFIAPASGEVVIACRLGHWGSINTGKAWFDNLSLSKVD